MTGTAFVVGDADDGLRERLNEEINAFNVAATGLADGGLVGIAVRDDGGVLGGFNRWSQHLHVEVGGWGDHGKGYLPAVLRRPLEPGLCAGLFGWTWGGCGYIEVLWVRADQRGAAWAPGCWSRRSWRSGAGAAARWP
jgi:hypothetical protein